MQNIHAVHTVTYLFLLVTLLRLSPCVGTLYSQNFNSNGLSGISLNSSRSVCGPGFYGEHCELCSATYYRGLLRCDGTRSVVLPGYWVGEGENGTLCTGNCPYGFCSYNHSSDYRLPGSLSELDAYICGDTRTGVLCGECRPGYSVSYHSEVYTCTSNDNSYCKYGWLL